VPTEIAASTIDQPGPSSTPATPAPAEPQAAQSPAPAFADIAAAISKLPSDAPPLAEQQPATALAQLDVKAAVPKAATPRQEPKPKPLAESKAKEDPAKKEEAAKKKEPTKAELAKKEALAKKEEAAKKAEADKKAEVAKPKEPSRIWVQIAGGADKKALPREFARMKEKAPKLLASQSAWTTPLRFTNRLLVGPFKTEKEAQDLVNKLNEAGFTTFTWTSPAGQEIEKLGK
jgi:flagellar biosynthesis GTPase FlhF